MAKRKAQRFTPAEFGQFQAEFRRWQDWLGMGHYEIFFEHRPISDAYAQITADPLCSTAVVVLDKEVHKDDLAGCDVFRTARHEAIHLLPAKLVQLARDRYANPQQIDGALEELVRRLERLLPGPSQHG